MAISEIKESTHEIISIDIFHKHDYNHPCRQKQNIINQHGRKNGDPQSTFICPALPGLNHPSLYSVLHLISFFFSKHPLVSALQRQTSN